MKPKLGLVALLALAALAGPVATANADNTFDGNCEIWGIAKFDNLLTGTPGPNRYHFLSGDPMGGNAPDKSTCTGTLNGVQVDAQGGLVSAFVNGPGTLSCGASESDTPGIGGLTFKNGNVSIGINLSFVGTASEVTLNVTGSKSGTAGGNASFRDYVRPQDAAQECGGTGDPNGDGVMGYKQLGFHALIQGVTPLTSAGAPPNPSGGGGGGGTAGGGGGSTGGGSGGGATGQVSVAFRALAQRLQSVLRSGIQVALSASAPVKASLVAQVDSATARRVHLARAGRPVVIGRTVVNLTRPGRIVAKVPLTAKAKRKLAQARGVRVQVLGTIRDVTGRTRSLSTRVTLR